ncbi:phytyl ester synthase 1, chloroplastic-like [Andrographis paniculata]|uniref:phytyl ester synthase 1, chloroplastic-like n=1 Tax=Andrographis paniculata TaxID=175694 RepID=UPI0021E864FA|nr:phytyl ester synthase 1, chloroplastic-like [Andrographis paniculata]
MATNVAGFSWPLILLNRENKSCYPGFNCPKIPCKLWTISKVGRACSSSTSGLAPKNLEVKELKLLWDDGYGTQTVKDYLEAARDMTNHDDAGPPRWFCPIESGPPLKNSPVLFYLPGLDGVGMGMILHHKPLGKVFELRCMHIPVRDRTPYQQLVRFVETAVRIEYASHPNRPIYLVGDSFGGCLALSVAAANPTIDLVLILVNPATSFNMSQLQPLIPLLEAVPEELYKFLPYLFTTTFGNPIKMSNMVNITNPSSSPAKKLEKLILQASVLLDKIVSVPDILLPKQTLIWKIELLKTAAAHSNSRLHTFRGEVLILASGKDSVLPSKSEAGRLTDTLKNCRVRFFKDNGHLLLMEEGINLLSLLKGLGMFRRSKKHHDISDFLPPSKAEFQTLFDRDFRFYRIATSPVMLSTLPDGKMVKGLAGIPQQGPVLLVGNHMLLGVDLISIAEGFLRERNILIRGLAHPAVFTKDMDKHLQEVSLFDSFRVFGAVPATPTNFFKLLSKKSHVLLYPGGVREALHGKGELHKLFWLDEPEFVRMAIKYRATIVPFGAVGEDDLFEMFLDYEDLAGIPVLKNKIEGIRIDRNVATLKRGNQREEETNKPDYFIPGLYPKVPGRLYFLFGKPIETKGKEELLKDNIKVKELYLEIKSGVEQNIAYLLEKREEDPYRQLSERLFYRAISSPAHQIPSFDP